MNKEIKNVEKDDDDAIVKLIMWGIIAVCVIALLLFIFKTEIGYGIALFILSGRGVYGLFKKKTDSEYHEEANYMARYAKLKEQYKGDELTKKIKEDKRSKEYLDKNMYILFYYVFKFLVLFSFIVNKIYAPVAIVFLFYLIFNIAIGLKAIERKIKKWSGEEWTEDFVYHNLKQDDKLWQKILTKAYLLSETVYFILAILYVFEIYVIQF